MPGTTEGLVRETLERASGKRAGSEFGLGMNPEFLTEGQALADFQEQFTSDWPLLMAAVVISSLPVIGLFLLGQRQFLRGIATTGIKN